MGDTTGFITFAFIASQANAPSVSIHLSMAKPPLLRCSSTSYYVHIEVTAETKPGPPPSPPLVSG